MTTTYVCTGKDCRRDVGHKELKAALDAVSHVKRRRVPDVLDDRWAKERHGKVKG